ncbi:hypothetical protein M432DRAFT_596269 [Thermoascus aurantiacus ATCC 26904]
MSNQDTLRFIIGAFSISSCQGLLGHLMSSSCISTCGTQTVRVLFSFPSTLLILHLLVSMR